MILPGLVSATFRQLSADEIIKLCLRAKLSAIEWAGDTHASHGNIEQAIKINKSMLNAGLQTSAYGSYYYAGISEKKGLKFNDVLASAKALNAPTIRIWAGNQASNAATTNDIRNIIDDSRRIATLAAAENISISFEYHRNTLTDKNESAYNLLNSIQHKNIRTFWQPHNGSNLAYRIAGFSKIIHLLTNIHVFHWENPQTRHPLEEGKDLWQPVLNLAKSSGQHHFASLEFVKDDSPENFLQDAATLKSWLA